MTDAIKLKTLQDFSQRVNEKRDFHHKKWERARKSETMNFHFKRYRLFDNMSYRITNLFFSLRRNRKFGEVPEWMKGDPEFYKEQRRKSKEEGKLKFDSNYRIFLHFMSESLHADYGTHKCDKCSRTFYHSPATVYLGKEKNILIAVAIALTTYLIGINKSKCTIKKRIMSKKKPRLRVEIKLFDWEIIPILLYRMDPVNKYKSTKLYCWLCFQVSCSL